MKRIKANYHTLHVLKTAQTKLRKAFISNLESDNENCISECVLNAPNGNIALTGCDSRKRRKQKQALRKLFDRQVPLPGKKRLIVQRGGFVLPLLPAVLSTLASLFAAK